MDELAKRTTAVAANTASGIVSPAVAAVFTMAGVAFRSPVIASLGVPAGAAAGALTGELAGVAGQLWSKRAEKVVRFTQTAADHSGAPIEELVERAAADPRTLELLATAAEAASRSVDEWKIDVFARAFVAGVTDSTKVDGALFVTEVVKQIDLAHVRLLRVLVRPGTGQPGDVKITMTATTPSGPPGRTAECWPRHAILRHDPGLAEALDPMLTRLVSLGLAEDAGDSRWGGFHCWALTTIGVALAEYLTARDVAADIDRD